MGDGEGGGKYLSMDGEMKKKLPQAVFPQHLEGEIKFPALLKNFLSSRLAMYSRRPGGVA